MQEQYLNRFSRIEGSISTLAGQVFAGQSSTSSTLSELRDEMHRVMSSIALFSVLLTSVTDRMSAMAAVLQVSPAPMIMQPNAEAIQKLCAFCNASSKRCTATTSLRHMMFCDQCPPNSCRHTAISNHLFSYKHEPLVGPPGECCWCGNTWDKCTNSSNSLSPKSADAQSKHKKSCHVNCHRALGSDDPCTVQNAKTILDRIWSKINVNDRVRKRARGQLQFQDKPPSVGNFQVEDEVGGLIEVSSVSSDGWTD